MGTGDQDLKSLPAIGVKREVKSILNHEFLLFPRIPVGLPSRKDRRQLVL